MGLDEYNRKRNFGDHQRSRRASPSHAAMLDGELSFVIQKHAATRLHYDFRLELDGVLTAGRCPRGPPSTRP